MRKPPSATAVNVGMVISNSRRERTCQFFSARGEDCVFPRGSLHCGRRAFAPLSSILPGRRLTSRYSRVGGRLGGGVAIGACSGTAFGLCTSHLVTVARPGCRTRDGTGMGAPRLCGDSRSRRSGTTRGKSNLYSANMHQVRA